MFSDVMGAYWCADFLAAVHLWKQCVVLWSWWGIFHCVWQGDGDLALQHMQKLLRALHSFIHPSNTGRWSVRAVGMSASLCAFVCACWKVSFCSFLFVLVLCEIQLWAGFVLLLRKVCKQYNLMGVALNIIYCEPFLKTCIYYLSSHMWE